MIRFEASLFPEAGMRSMPYALETAPVGHAPHAVLP
jgi:hypothetical protein